MEFPFTGMEEPDGIFVVVIESMGSTVTSVASPRHTTCLFGIICDLSIVLVVFVFIVESIDVDHNDDVVLLL